MSEETMPEGEMILHTPCAGKEPGDSEKLVRINSLQKGFPSPGGRITILGGVDMCLEKGDTMAIVGASGIGKSTLLHILGALDRPDEGKVFISGKDIFALDDTRLARFRNRTIGFVFQFHHLLQEFTALENVMMPSMISRVKKGEAKQKAKTMLERVGLENRMEHRVTDLSGGEQQRVALARALTESPALLLADEPTGNLDRKNSEVIHNLLLELNQDLDMTLVVVTHNPDLAGLMERRVTLLEGKLKEIT